MQTQRVSGINFRMDSGIKEENVKTENNTVTQPSAKKNNKVLPLVTAAVAVASLGVSAYALKGHAKANGAIDGYKKAAEEAKKMAEEAKKNAEVIKNDAEELKKAAEEKIESLKNKITELNKKVSDAGTKAAEAESKSANAEKIIAEKQQWNEGYLNALDSKIKASEGVVKVVTNGKIRNVTTVDNLVLMKNVDNAGNRIPLATDVKTKLNTVASRYITGNGIVVPALAASAAVWLPTAESLPEKEGGLGEVPVQIARNLNNEFGVENYIVRPLNEIPGVSTLQEVDGKYRYWYKGLKDENGKLLDYMSLEKVMDFDTNVVRNGDYQTEHVEVFYGIDPSNGYKRLMFRNPDYFKASSLYANSQTATEPERYNFFSKLVYEFAKIKSDPKSMTSYNILNQALFDSIKAPDAMVLNDWHTAPIAALMRLKAPVEAANKELAANTAKTFEDMNLLYIVHNSDYHGWGGEYSSDMLNTLFDKYSYDIYKNALTGFTEEITDADGEVTKVPIDSLKNVLTVEGSVNMANMGMALATKVKPVSPTYALEMSTEPERGHALTHIAEVRYKAGTMAGQSNGWDRAVNEVSESQLANFNGNLNKDKITIFVSAINNVKGLSESQRKLVTKTMGSPNNNNYLQTITNLRKLNIPQVTAEIEKLKQAGVTEPRTFKAETADMDMESIMEARKHNKAMLFDYLKSMVEFNRHENREVFNIKESGLTDLSDIKPEDLDDIPFFNMGVRFVGQKGVPVATGAWEKILNNWDTLYPGKKRPIVVIGGADAEGGKHRNTVSNAKRRLQEKGKHFVQMDGFVPNNILMAGSDWTMRPSYFEPDGDKWESLYKGTPAVLTRTGGHVDSVKDGYNGILTKRTMKEIRDELRGRGLYGDALEYALTEELINDYADALKRTLDAFYNKTNQRDFVDHAIHGNQSWVQRDSDGKILECPLVGHLRDLGFNLADFKQISESVSEK